MPDLVRWIIFALGVAVVGLGVIQTILEQRKTEEDEHDSETSVKILGLEFRAASSPLALIVFGLAAMVGVSLVPAAEDDGSSDTVTIDGGRATTSGATTTAASATTATTAPPTTTSSTSSTMTSPTTSTTTPPTTSTTVVTPNTESPSSEGAWPPIVGDTSATEVHPDSTDACNNPTSYQPDLLVDRRYDTAWMARGDGTGERITIQLEEPSRVTSVGLVPGYTKQDPCTGTNRFLEFRRVTAVLWSFDHGTEIVQRFTSDPQLQIIPINPPVVTSRVELEILSTSEPGVSNLDHTPISEIEMASWDHPMLCATECHPRVPHPAG